MTEEYTPGVNGIELSPALFSGLAFRPKRPEQESVTEVNSQSKQNTQSHTAHLDHTKKTLAAASALVRGRKRTGRVVTRLVVTETHQYAPIEYGERSSDHPMMRPYGGGDALYAAGDDFGDYVYRGNELALEDQEDLLQGLLTTRTRNRNRRKAGGVGAGGAGGKGRALQPAACEPGLLLRNNNKTVGGRIGKARRGTSSTCTVLGNRPQASSLSKVVLARPNQSPVRSNSRDSGDTTGCDNKDSGPTGGVHRLLPARQFLRRERSVSATAPLSPVGDPVPVSSDTLWDAIFAMPGFLFPHTLKYASSSLLPLCKEGDGVRLGRILADPSVVRKCGRSLVRRRLPNFVISVMTFPIRVQHGKGSFERAGGYTCGDEHRPAFWSQFADAFAAWLGLAARGSSRGQIDPFDGGRLLQKLVTLFSTARVRYLYHVHGEFSSTPYLATLSAAKRGGTSPVGSNSRQRAKRRTIVDTDDEDGEEDNTNPSEIYDSVGKVQGERDCENNDIMMDDTAYTTSQTKRTQPSQSQRKVSVATDAWLLFLDKSHNADFDLEMLIDLNI
ncbi:hypothetical protein SPI_09146 [Niveomyces insectorum RCEF 264]|uniref:Uncharacterized protein n=1 Tax=Niveomyces insectorum RCEF 264 TaxID=1081102 RepID=A0A167M549_9HYPO|nr:hypothetical protein SPI_09146 [Niveomyces insectorum RCEF 264]